MGLISCFKLLLYAFNVLFVLIGCTMVGLGIWTAVAKVYVSFVIGDSLFSAASYMLIGVGVVTAIVCIVGICALRTDSSKGLMVYFILLIVCFIFLISAAILAVVFKAEVDSVMAQKMRESLIKKYGVDREVTDAWDQLQKDLRCCAISQTPITSSLSTMPYADNIYPTEKENDFQDSWPIYKRTEFYRRQRNLMMTKRKYVPASCCVFDLTLKDILNLQYCQFFPTGPPYNYNAMLKNEYIYYEGCYEKAKKLVLSQSDIIMAISFVFGFIMIAGMVLTFLLMRWLSSEQDEVTGHRRTPDHL